MISKLPDGPPTHTSASPHKSNKPNPIRRISTIPPFNTRLLPTGSPFTWTVRERSIYVQMLTFLMAFIVAICFVWFDGQPYVAEPVPEEALRKTTLWVIGSSVFWLGFYVWTWRVYVRRRRGFSWFLTATITLHVISAGGLCYIIGPFSATSGIIAVSSLVLGLMLLERRWLWVAVAGWFVVIVCAHLLSLVGALPFLPIFEASLDGDTTTPAILGRILAAALIYIPLAFIMDRLIGVWRQDDRTLHEAAQFDVLTRTYTRRYALAVMHRAIAKADTVSSPVAVLMLDIDRFKAINDTYGHSVGDEVLKATTVAVQSTLRAGDIVGRYGGEEFVLFLPGADLVHAIGAAERCRKAVEDMRVSVTGVKELLITASFGVAAYPEHGDNLDVLLRAADKALYKAKQGGRNRVETAGFSSMPAPAPVRESVG